MVECMDGVGGGNQAPFPLNQSYDDPRVSLSLC